MKKGDWSEKVRVRPIEEMKQLKDETFNQQLQTTFNLPKRKSSWLFGLDVNTCQYRDFNRTCEWNRQRKSTKLVLRKIQ